MSETGDYRQKRCRHGWVDVSQCEVCKTERELTAMRTTASKAMADYETANHALAKIAEERNQLEKERDALIAENALTQRACDSWRKLAMDRLDERNALAEENEWKPIETAPKNGMTVQLLCPGGVDTGHWCDYRDRGYEINGEWSTEHGHGEPCKWRPLPQPPKGQP